MEQQVSAVARQTLSQKQNGLQRKGRHALSERQQGEMDKFRKHFPDETSLCAYFAPVKWAGVLGNANHSLLYPSVTLLMIGRTYYEGIPKQIVYNNLTGIFKMAEPREPINESVIDMTADIFVSKFGAELSVFGMLYYFAAYLTEYKSSYGKFDLQDVLRQCGKVFMPWWRNRLGKVEEKEKQAEETSKEVGKAALWTYLRREYVAQGRSVRESNLYRYGMIPEKDIRAIEEGDELII